MIYETVARVINFILFAQPLALSNIVKNVSRYDSVLVNRLKAKFHYAILVADRSEAGRRPVADLLARASSLDSASYAKFQLATGLQPGLRPG